MNLERRILAEFQKAPNSGFYGYELLHRTRMSSGPLYQTLNKLMDQGILVAEWRNVDLDGNGGRPYRVYHLTEKGKRVQV